MALATQQFRGSSLGASGGAPATWIYVSQVQLLLRVLELFLDVFLISLNLPLHLRTDGWKWLIRFGFVTGFEWQSSADQDNPDAPIHIEKAELQQLLELVGIIEEAIEYIDGHIEEHTYECLEFCCQIRKALNKILGILTVLL